MQVLEKFSATEMLKMSTTDLQGMLSGEFILIFPDGEIQTNAKETIYSSYFWDLIREFPETQLSIKHHVGKLLNGAYLGNNTHLKLLGEVVCWSIMDTYQGKEWPTKDHLALRSYQVSNTLYNAMVFMTEKHVVSMDILDLIEIQDQPRVRTAIDTVNPDNITDCYEVIGDVLKKDPAVAHNPLAKAVRANLVKFGQVLQCIGPRGYVTDIDSHIFHTPILRGFVQGLRGFYDSLIESRSAAKSLFFSAEPLKDAEYSARKLQLVNMIIENLHPGDCGSTAYMRWTIRDKEYGHDGRVTRNTDLEYFDGKYYLDEEKGTYKVLRKWDKHLIGKSLKFRSPVAGCAHPDPYGICETCFGDLAYSIVDKTNLGHVCSAAMNQQSSQNVLSVKHYDNSASVEMIEILDIYKGYIKASTDGASYLLDPRLKDFDVKLVVSSSDVPGITDIMNVERVTELVLSHVSEIDTITMVVSQGDVEIPPIPIEVSIDRRKASFTHELMQHIKEVGWNLDERNNYVIDMSEWDFSQNVMTLPLRHYNMSDHAKAITSVIESSKSKSKERAIQSSPEEAMKEIYDLVNSKLNVNVALLEVIVLGIMVISVDHRNYNVPKAGEPKGLGVTALTLPARSLSAAMAYEDQTPTLMNPASFFPENRPSSILDVAFKPKEVMEDEKIPWNYNLMR